MSNGVEGVWVVGDDNASLIDSFSAYLGEVSARVGIAVDELLYGDRDVALATLSDLRREVAEDALILARATAAFREFLARRKAGQN